MTIHCLFCFCSSADDDEMPADFSVAGSLPGDAQSQSVFTLVYPFPACVINNVFLKYTRFTGFSFNNDSAPPYSQPEQSTDHLPPRPAGILRRFSSEPNMPMDIAFSTAGSIPQGIVIVPVPVHVRRYIATG